MHAATAIARISRRIDGVRSHTEPGQVFICDDETFASLIASGAAREPTEAEMSLAKMGGLRVPADLDRPERDAPVAPVAPAPKDDAQADQPKVALKPKKKGQVYVVIDETDSVVSGDETFANRDAALDWIETQAAQATAEDLLS